MSHKQKSVLRDVRKVRRSAWSEEIQNDISSELRFVVHSIKAIILHVGTNDLKTSSSARNVAEKIVDLGNIIATNSPNTSVTISAITQRSDEESLKIKVKDCNKVLRTFCNQNGWGFVEHLNIDETCLNNYIDMILT